MPNPFDHDVAAERPPSVTGPLLLVAWLAGPASYGAAFLCYVVFPEFCYGHADPGPDPLLAVVLVVTHCIAGVCTAEVVFRRGRHWQAPELWLLLVYWAAIVGWVGPMFCGLLDIGRVTPAFSWICTRIALAAASLVPIVAALRRVSFRSRSK